jgi:metal-responsive CopG/Arc/MetJ family transcriptional regulator
MIGDINDRSEFIESILREYLDEVTKKDQNLKDLEILNHNSEYFNDEAEDVLTYQMNLCPQ